jgi:endonuclease III
VTSVLFSIAPDTLKPKNLAVKKIKNIISPCILFRNKARAIRSRAQTTPEQYNRRVSETFEEFEKLPDGAMR